MWFWIQFLSLNILVLLYNRIVMSLCCFFYNVTSDLFVDMLVYQYTNKLKRYGTRQYKFRLESFIIAIFVRNKKEKVFFRNSHLSTAFCQLVFLEVVFIIIIVPNIHDYYYETTNISSICFKCISSNDISFSQSKAVN
jgi:hypothetical protein